MFAVMRRVGPAAVAVCVLLPALGVGTGQGPRAEEGEHLVMGNPSKATTDKAQRDNYLLKRRQYALSYNNSKGAANWTSWHLNKSWLGKVRRTNPFAPDPALPEGFFAVRPNDYRASGFDRGHLCPAADRSASKEDMDATFLMSNMVPQSPDLNRKTWEHLESYCRDQAREGREDPYIVAGPAGRGGWGENGYKTYLRGSGGKITVPAQSWKVVLILPAGGTRPKMVTAEQARVIAVILPNLQGLDSSWRAYRVTVRDVEELTGLNFFSALPADVAKELRDRKADARPKVAGKETEKKAKKGGKAPADGTLPAFVEGCVIGNSRSKVYHLPTGRVYAVARKSKNAVFFKTEADAKKAGYTAAKR